MRGEAEERDAACVVAEAVAVPSRVETDAVDVVLSVVCDQRGADEQPVDAEVKNRKLLFACKEEQTLRRGDRPDLVAKRVHVRLDGVQRPVVPHADNAFLRISGAVRQTSSPETKMFGASVAQATAVMGAW